MLPRTIDLADDRADRGVPLSERYERFIGHFCETRNPGQAFRIAFVPDRTMSHSVVQQLAARLLKDATVQARTRELLDAAAASTTCSVRELLRTYYEIATADPNEIISHVIDCCRHCHGLDFEFQWVDEREYAKAVQTVMDHNAALPAAAASLRRAMPEMCGGFGYWPTIEPNPACPHCFGRGVGRTVLHDTTKLSAAARKLYKGVKETKNGIEVLMHDQAAAHEALLRVAGAFKDAVPLTPPPAPGSDAAGDLIPADASESDAGRAYLRLVGGTG